jgi:hypothetical protein
MAAMAALLGSCNTSLRVVAVVAFRNLLHTAQTLRDKEGAEGGRELLREVATTLERAPGAARALEKLAASGEAEDLEAAAAAFCLAALRQNVLSAAQALVAQLKAGML